MPYSRRTFLQLTAAATVAPVCFLAQNARKQESDVPLVDQVPPMLDHILLGCNDLQRGLDFVEQHAGVRAAFGGVHPGRATQNALLSFRHSALPRDHRARSATECLDVGAVGEARETQRATSGWLGCASRRPAGFRSRPR